MVRSWTILNLAAAAIMAAGAALAQPQLLMLDEQYCEWCEQWDAEVGVIYDKTAEGKRAPLLRQSIHDPIPADITLNLRAQYTPTFVLLDEGVEIGRIEGYPGEDFFWGMLGQMIEKLPEPQKLAAKEPDA